MIRAALLIAASTIASASPLSAQLYSAAEGDVLSRLIDTACIDLTDDIGCEQVTLLASADGEPAADLFIYPNVQNDADAPIWTDIKADRHDAGAVIGPFEAWLLVRGMRTLNPSP